MKPNVVLGFLFLSFFSQPSFANHNNWQETFFGRGCGNNEYQAKQRARLDSRSQAQAYEAECETEAGVFSVTFAKVLCSEDFDNISCRVECAEKGTATCSF